ncbi:uracil-DNA glycosylase [Patescibacteria group bacterium]|nr:uracil-DNA glycosylase [Patescibacteria group bacterium]MBU1702790.1 uracil-DNA glycosylase [Patescibacteria group bacterium]MBU1953817.1 uracil-DNA glycosylase [Patescibacteria group bacterium]
MENDLQMIREKINKCRLCRLYQGAHSAVPGEGSAVAQVMFIGEAPGKDEDLQGKPFVGAAGKFLSAMLEGIGMKREDVFITNIVKHRPPDNRDPLEDEVETCFPYLDAQINAIKPKLIVTLGRHAMHRFLPDLKISEVHGQAKRVKSIFSQKQVILPLYHPASALYNPSMRSTLIHDMKKIPILLKKINDAS